MFCSGQALNAFERRQNSTRRDSGRTAGQNVVAHGALVALVAQGDGGRGPETRFLYRTLSPRRRGKQELQKTELHSFWFAKSKNN